MHSLHSSVESSSCSDKETLPEEALATGLGLLLLQPLINNIVDKAAHKSILCDVVAYRQKSIMCPSIILSRVFCEIGIGAVGPFDTCPSSTRAGDVKP